MVFSECISLLSSVIIGLSGIVATIYYSKNSTDRENDRIMLDLFREFNARYDLLNDKLYSIIKNDNSVEQKTLTLEEKNTIYDFFNLCAEEFFWYKKGRIDEKLWKSWNAGMNFWYGHKVIKDLWLEEMKSKTGKTSYYLDNDEEFFK